ncbi:MAG: ATP-binding protein [Candidatus Latescibacteria bacterium]|nr:ATP-binding protein [Candidatus Latescibacterota bacterium]
MIRRVEALRYRCLLDIQQEVGPFQILVGANASGKSTFIDVLRLIGDLLKDGLVTAIRRRSPNLANLIWMEQGSRFDVAVELDIPEERRSRLQNGFARARYEIALGFDAKGELSILGENLWLKPATPTHHPVQQELFPNPPPPREVIVLPEGRRSPAGWKKVVTKKPESGNDYFFAETTGWNNPFRLGPQRLALANLPEDEERFPVAIWVKRVLLEGVQHLVLNSEAMRRPAPPGSPTEFQPDGSNLPWAIEELLKKDRRGFERWIAHVRTALPDLQTVETVEREEDKHRYLRVVYETGLKAPSWTVSDGTLRLLALTLVAYLEEPGRVYLIEEPENGIHPRAVETVFQSLSSTYEAQILCASHSPIILSLAEPEQLLCFAQTREGATDIVRGSEHPNLKEWRRGTDLGTLFATGVLG